MELRKRRKVLMMTSLFTAHGHCHKVRIRDVSDSGIALSCALQPLVSDKVHVCIPHVGLVGGEVVWADRASFGVAFARKIDSSEVRLEITGSYRRPEEPVLHPLYRYAVA